MKASRIPFNPFIVLSDVTISTLVILASLLMVFSAVIAESARVEHRKAAQARKIQGEQKTIAAMDLKWKITGRGQKRNNTLPHYHAQGLQSYLFRFPGIGDALFRSKPHSDELSQAGVDVIREFAQYWSDELQQLQRRHHVGALVEIQIQGHCSRLPREDPWVLSTKRAIAVARILRQYPKFPTQLITISGCGWYRRAFMSSEEARREWKRKKPVLSDRIDIRLVFAGDRNDDDFVAAWDGDPKHWGDNDTSSPEWSGSRPTR